MNIFEKATKLKLRYPTGSIGDINTEQLWDLPLTAKRAGQPDLDRTAQNLAKQLRELPEESFVRKANNSDRSNVELALDVVKHIITYKQDAATAAANRIKKADEASRLREILAKREDEKLEKLDEAEITARLARLDAESSEA